MKKSLVLALLLCSTFVFSQEDEDRFLIAKGVWELGGQFSISSTSQDSFSGTSSSENNAFGFEITPRVGYAINDNLILGLGLSYGYSDTENEAVNAQFLTNTQAARSNSYGFFPYIQKFFPIGKKFALNVRGEATYIFRDNIAEDFNGVERNIDSDFFAIGLRPGFSYRVNKNILLDANFGFFGYQYSDTRTDGQVTTELNRISFGINSSNLLFGFTVLL